MSSLPSLPTGTVIRDRYRVVDVLGKGGTAVVYLVRDINLDKFWALKVVSVDDSPRGQVLLKGVIAETNLLKSLSYTTIPRITEVFRTSQHLYIIMDYVDGKSLLDIIKDATATKKVIPDAEIIKVAKALCRTLRYLHTREPAIIYRDMKPHNIMVTSTDEVRVLDFGAAYEMREGVDTAKVPIIGTRGYAPPEQLQAATAFDTRADIFALGRTLYHMATGIEPYRFAGGKVKVNGQVIERPERPLPNLIDVCPHRSAALIQVINKAMHPDLSHRFDSADEMLYYLENLDHLSENYRAKQRRRFFGVVGACAGLILGFTLSFGGFIQSRRSDEVRYQNLLSSGVSERNLDDLVEAGSISPRVEVLSALLDVAAEDGTFSPVEEEKVLSFLRDGDAVMSEQEPSEFLDQAYRLGRLYWYSYHNGQSKASSWFQRVSDAGDTHPDALVFSAIAQFNAEVSSRQADGSDGGIYADYYNQLISIDRVMADDDALTLTVVTAFYDLLDGYSADLKFDGLLHEDLSDSLDSMDARLSAVSPKSQRAEEVLSSLVSRQQSVRVSLDTAFGKRDSGSEGGSKS